MSNSRVKSEAEYSMIRSNQDVQSNDPNPFKATSNGNDYFDAITRRHKEEQQQYGNPFEPSHNMMPASNQMPQPNQMPSNHMPQSAPSNYMNEIPMENVSNIKQSIASNQSTGNVTDGLSSPFETVSFDPNANPNATNPNFNANLNPNINPNANPNINVQGYNNQMYNNQQVYENQQMYNTQPQPQPYNVPQNNPMNPQDIGQNSMQNMGPTVDMQPSQMQEMPTMMPQHNPMNANYNNFGPDPNQQMNNNMTNPYGMPGMPQTNEQITIAQQADKINDLINGINQGAIAPELRYEDSTGMGLMNNMGPYMNNGSGVDDIAIMDDIDKELEAMLHETDINIDPDKGDFTSENENLIEEIKRAEHQGSPRNSNQMNGQINENAEQIQRKLNEIAQGSSNGSSNYNTPPRGNEPKVQPDNAIDQMINELDSDGSSNKTNNNSKNLSDTLTLALDKNEVMQISKEKMLAEDLEDTKKKKSKIDILINIVLLIMILVVLGLVAKMILG